MLRASLLASAALLSPRLTAQTLGSIDFPTSGSTTARPHFLRGVLYLHSFEYDAAAAAFREAQKLAPDFTMAYWGEAMTHTHPVWNEQNRDAARAGLSKLASTPAERLAKVPTARERAYLGAVETLYGDGSKERRDTLYSAAMERLSRAYPADLEAQAFYALSLIGLSQGTRDIPTYERAGAIAEKIFEANPNHPGAVHYIIHAYDDPLHAPRGLAAAKAYSKIAPDAAHAQHMTTHIFVAIGMWDDVVSQNEIASGHDHSSWRPGHYTAWLGYGYLQQGRQKEARKHLETVRSNLGESARPGARAYLLSMRAHYLVNTELWDDDATGWVVDTVGLGAGVRSIDAFALGLAALRRGQRPAAERFLTQLVLRGKEASAGDSYGGSQQLPVILEKQLRALFHQADGATDDALSLLREGARLEDALPPEFGPPDIVKPSHELLGEAFLALRRPGEAQRSFARALELAPNRALSLVGLARAAAAAGDRKTAARAYADLRAIWHGADPDLPALAEATRFIAALR